MTTAFQAQKRREATLRELLGDKKGERKETLMVQNKQVRINAPLAHPSFVSQQHEANTFVFT